RPGALAPLHRPGPAPPARRAAGGVLGRGHGRARALLAGMHRPVRRAPASQRQRRDRRPRAPLPRLFPARAGRRRGAGRPRAARVPARLHGVGGGRGARGLARQRRRRPRRRRGPAVDLGRARGL
ncbi:MAG: hypothetical protein AVDCRST_MAG54-3443, partial [uncultured Actinomycetospora sp.]